MREIPKDAAVLLEKWNGGKAKLWVYNVSFQQLVIRVEKPQELPGNLHITCSPCLSIIAPVVVWNNSNLSISKIKDDELVGATFRLEDKYTGVVIECMGLHVDENVEPIFYTEERIRI